MVASLNVGQYVVIDSYQSGRLFFGCDGCRRVIKENYDAGVSNWMSVSLRYAPLLDSGYSYSYSIYEQLICFY